MPAWWQRKSKSKPKPEPPARCSSSPCKKSDLPEVDDAGPNRTRNPPSKLKRSNKKEKAARDLSPVCCAGGGGSDPLFTFGHPLPRPVSAPLPSLPHDLAVAGPGSGSASASASSGSSSASDETPGPVFYRYSDHMSMPRGRNLTRDPQRQDHIAEDKHQFMANTVLENRRCPDISTSARKEINLFNLEAPTHHHASDDNIFNTVNCPRGHPLSTSPVRPRAIRTCPSSPKMRHDDLKCPSYLLPLPPGSPGSSSSPHSFASQWKKGKLLGRGTFGHVYLGFNSERGQMCAIKEVKVISDDTNSKECLRQLNQEISLLSQLSHPNIVQYYDSELVDDTLCVYLEYVSGGSIHKLLQEYGPFGEPVIRNYARQILSGIAYLHGRNTVHRDIKGANMLVDPNGEVKLADFGMAKHISAYTLIRSFKGSPYWMAPEVIMNGNGYNLSVDIWSLGCTILEMATSKPPWSQYEGVAAIFKIGNSKDIPDIPGHLSSDAKSFLKLCLQRDPAARPTAAKLLEHPFVKGFSPPYWFKINLMGLLQRNNMKGSDCRDNYDAGKASKGKTPKRPCSCVVSALTFLQFSFLIYATVLICSMSSLVDLPTKPDLSRATQLMHQWKHIIIHPQTLAHIREDFVVQPMAEACEQEHIDFEQKKSNDTLTIKLKRELYDDVLRFQQSSFGAETLDELMRMKSKWGLKGPNIPKVTVILNHFKRKTLCSQLDALLHQTLPFHHVWVISFGSPKEQSLKKIVSSYNNSKISFISSSYDFKYYGRFQMALQTGSDFVYILDDDMIPGRRMLEILSHVGGTKKYQNSVLGSIGRILPFRQKDFSFPSYRKFRSKEAGLYLPDPAYDIDVKRIVQVDFLSSSWFLSADLVKTLFVEKPFTFGTGEDLHLSYQLQKYRDAGSFVLPVDPKDKSTWGDSDHRLAYVSETTVIFKDVVQVRDAQWWRALSSGYVTQWAAMYPQKIDALFYAHSIQEVKALAPLLEKFRATARRKAYIAVSGGSFCPCEEAAAALKWPMTVCKERRLKIFDLDVGATLGVSNSEVPILQTVYSSIKGLLKSHNPSLLITVADVNVNVKNALKMAAEGSQNKTALVLLPTHSIPKVLWMADLRQTSLPDWNRMRISVNIITQNRPSSLQRLLRSLQNAYYIGDEIPLSFNMDRKVDEETLKVVGSFNWTHGPKLIRRRIVQGGLIRAVSESWYPSSDDDFGLFLEDDIEVSPYYYLWIKYALMAYYYDPQVSLPELSSISLYTPRLVEVVKERPKWNATEFFKHIHPNTPYLHQLPCSWGAVFFPKHWREFYAYVGERFTEDAKQNPVQIPKSRTNGWQASWKKFLIDMMYLRGYVSLYPNFPNQMSFSTNHMEPGAHISAKDNAVKHNKVDFEVPLMKDDFTMMLPDGKMPSAPRLPVLNLFNQPTPLRGLKVAGAKLGQDVMKCSNDREIVVVDHKTGVPQTCSPF